MNEFLLSLLPELIGSLVGAFTGFLLGMLIVKNTRIEDEKERKEDTIKSLLTEITDNKRILDKELIEREFSANVNVTYMAGLLTTDAFESTIFSGSISY